MSVDNSELPFITLDLNESAKVPVYQQIYDSIRKAILSGTCRPGTRLPSTRDLSNQLGISRTTVVNAYEQLFAEGYLESKVGAGTFVASFLPEELVEVKRANSDFNHLPAAQLPAPNLSERSAWLAVANKTAAMLFNPGNKEPTAFQHGLPALDHFPFEIWSRLLARRWRNPPTELLSYGGALGYPPLRETIATYLKTSRGVNCDPEQVFIVAGAQHAFDLAARVLLNPGDAVWIEDPYYSGARAAFIAAGGRVVGVPVDNEGFSLSQAMTINEKPKLVYITPSHQMPLGVTMSLRRRLALLDWARRSNAWILEDDYDSEFRYAGRPLASLQGLDQYERTLYVGSFSKILFPSLRLGCLVVPKSLVDIFAAARRLGDLQSPTIDQAVLNDFINDGHFARHLRRMRTLYKERQDILVSEARREIRGAIELAPDNAGLHLVGWLPAGVCDRCAANMAREYGVKTAALSSFSELGLNRGGLILGYAAVDENQIKAGVRLLAKALS